MTASILVKANCELGEGPRWHTQRQSLFWVDITNKTLYEYQPVGKNTRSWNIGRMVSLIFETSQPNLLLLGVQGGLQTFNLDTGQSQWRVAIDADRPQNRTNDGAIDPLGNIWVGTMDLQFEEGAGSLYRVDRLLNVSRQVPQLTIPNGLVFSADHQWMYHIDSPTGQVKAYRYNSATGDIQFDRIAITLPQGKGGPDGMTLDAEGMLWVAHWGGYGVYRYDPQTGKNIGHVAVPAPHVSCCVFGGKNFDTLYITTARQDMSAADLQQYPDSGSIFMVKPGVTGFPAPVLTLT